MFYTGDNVHMFEKKSVFQFKNGVWLDWFA